MVHCGSYGHGPRAPPAAGAAGRRKLPAIRRVVHRIDPTSPPFHAPLSGCVVAWPPAVVGLSLLVAVDFLIGGPLKRLVGLSYGLSVILGFLVLVRAVTIVAGPYAPRTRPCGDI